MRTVTLLRHGLFLGWVSLVGCGSARYVSTGSEGGVLAIPSNSNSWPTYYRDKAEALMRAKCPNGYIIEHEEEAVTGSVTQDKSSMRP